MFCKEDKSTDSLAGKSHTYVGATSKKQDSGPQSSLVPGTKLRSKFCSVQISLQIVFEETLSTVRVIDCAEAINCKKSKNESDKILFVFIAS
jgi:hypothetical protein